MKQTHKKLYLDQYGKYYVAATRKELIAQTVGGNPRCSIMYQDTIAGESYNAGYVISSMWLQEVGTIIPNFKHNKQG